MRNKIFKMMVSILLIITLTSANFILLGVNAVTYAVEQNSQEKATNHKNVEFMAYFKEGETQVSQHKEKANSTDIMLYLQIAVKQEGYFDGEISLENSNFKFKTDTTHERIHSITENKITLNQITAGETVEIPVGISLVTDTNFDVSLLTKESNLQLKGTYTFGSKPDTKEITGTRKVVLELVSPYDEENKGIVLTQTILTNKVFQYESKQNRVMQLQIEAGMEGNLYPVKSEKIELQAPELKGVYPKTVQVQSPQNLAVNGEKLQENNYTYDSTTGKVNITIENAEKDGKVLWEKSGTDKYIVTYVYEGTEQFEGQTLSANAEIALYDAENTITRAQRENSVPSEEMDSIVMVSLHNTENEIYKGLLYEGKEREITQNIDIQTNLENIADSIKVKEENIFQTKNVKLNLDNLTETLGDEGKVTIKNQATSTVIAQITKQTPADESKNIQIDIPAGTGAIEFETTKPVKEGILKITTTKVIPVQSRETVQQMTNIESKLHSSYTIGEVENTLTDAVSTIKLNETKTYAKLSLSKTEFSTMRTNENVEMRVTLYSNNEQYELYRNPHIKLTLPAEFEGINIKSVKLLNEEEMTIVDTHQDGNIIDIQLQGEQTSYKEEAIEGATILIVADLTTNKKQKNAETQFVLQYENQKAIHYVEEANIGTTNVGAKIVSYAGLITTNAISEYGLETINNEGNKSGKLALASEAKTATVSGQIINNNETKITDVSVLGTFPTQKATEENNIPVSVGDIQITGSENANIKVYYSENASATQDVNNTANAWRENILDATAVKKYLIVVKDLQVSEELDFAYVMNIPENLEYNKILSETYSVTYKASAVAEQKAEAHKLTLETGKGPEITTTLSAKVGSKDAQVVKEGEKIEYTITAKNTGSETVAGVTLVGKIPEGTVYVEELPSPTIVKEGEEQGEVTPDIVKEAEKLKEDKTKTEENFTDITLEPGQEVTKTYMVKVEKGTAQKTITNTAESHYGEAIKQSNTYTSRVETGMISLSVVSADDLGEVDAGYTYRYVVKIDNISDKELKNVKINLNTENGKINQILTDENVYTDTSEFTIENLSVDGSISLYLYVRMDQFTDMETKPVTIQAIGIVDGIEYQSNLKTVKSNAALVKITSISGNENQYVKPGDKITYNIAVTNEGTKAVERFELDDKISKYEELQSIQANGTELSKEQYRTGDELDGTGTKIEIDDTIEAKQTKNYTVTTQVDVMENEEAIEIPNTATAYAYVLETDKAEITHIIEPFSVKVDGDVDLNNRDNTSNNEEGQNGQTGTTGNQSGSSQNGSETPTQTVTKLISGVAWLDQNENGQKDADEPLLSGIPVKLFNTETNKFQTKADGTEITATTNSNGMYTLSEVPQGNYIVVFEFDNAKYALTAFKQQGVTSEKNSKVISSEMSIDGQTKTVAITEAISVDDNHISYMNIGLKERKKYDMKIEKMITRVVVQNANGTETTQFPDATLAKVEIHAKQLNSSNVVVEYKIRVTNEGEIPGYIRKIEDYVSADYRFSSELNKDWYQSGSSIYNSSLASEAIQPGESKEVTLILTKQMTENNTGLITNAAEITESYNEQGIKDMDSTEGNRAKGEDDMSSADLIISIKTGEVVATVTVIFATIAIIGTAAYIIIRKIMKPVEI